MPTLKVDPERMRRDFLALSEIGATGEGGVHRPALSEAHLEARRWFRRRVEADRLIFQADGAGNHSARLPAANPAARALLLGSHLDSVPYGGRFDGALGVVAALEALRAARDAGLSLPVHLEAVDFTDEEGTLVGLLGSRALAGALTEADLAAPRGGREAFLAKLGGAGLTEAGILSARREPESLAGFLELHIEQSSRLTAAGAQIGVVSRIVGIRAGRAVFVGRADHAGTTPMDQRRDAGLGSARFILAAHQAVRSEFPECVANFGWVALEPGAFNIVPARAELGVEFRGPDERLLAALEARLLDLARRSAAEFGLEFAYEPVGSVPPTACAPAAQGAFRAASDALGLRHITLTSGAGHDTMALAQACPAGMIFIPSTGGSHSAREHAEWQDCVNGADVLLGATLRLAGSA